jgi:hypothetical protein
MPRGERIEMNDIEYWKECIEIEAEESGLKMTAEQVGSMAAAVSNWHENYGMAFYQPPSGDRMAVIKQEWQAKLKRAEDDFDAYRHNAETAVKEALGRRHDDRVSIGKNGEVRLWDGRSDRIQ